MAQTAPESSSWKTRACPGVGSLINSFSLRSRNGRTFVRRVSMWTILLSRIIISIGIVVNRLLGARIFSTVLGVVLAVLNFVFIIWCLSVIDRAEGYRNVCCLRIGRTHLDIFLVAAALVHVFLLAGVFSFMMNSWIITNVLWFSLWALIVIYASICTSLPDSPA